MRSIALIFIIACATALVAAPFTVSSGNGGNIIIRNFVAFAGMGGGMGGGGGGGSGSTDCGGTYTHNHSQMCDSGGGMGGGMCGGGMGGGATYPNCGTGHHRMVAGGECVPCPNSSITLKAPTRAITTGRVIQHSQSTVAKPPRSINSGSHSHPGGATSVSGFGFKPPKSVAGGN